MGRICSWNVRGLTWPNKQEDTHFFLQLHQVGLIGMLETKVKVHKVDKVANKLFRGWQWVHNFNAINKGRIWVAWRPQWYSVHLLSKFDQYIHCKVFL